MPNHLAISFNNNLVASGLTLPATYQYTSSQNSPLNEVTNADQSDLQVSIYKIQYEMSCRNNLGYGLGIGLRKLYDYCGTKYQGCVNNAHNLQQKVTVSNALSYLHDAIISEDIESVQSLVKNQHVKNKINIEFNGETALLKVINTIDNQDLAGQMVAVLVEHGAFPNYYTQTELKAALHKGYGEIINQLVEATRIPKFNYLATSLVYYCDIKPVLNKFNTPQGFKERTLVKFFESYHFWATPQELAEFILWSADSGSTKLLQAALHNLYKFHKIRSNDFMKKQVGFHLLKAMPQYCNGVLEHSYRVEIIPEVLSRFKAYSSPEKQLILKSIKNLKSPMKWSFKDALFKAALQARSKRLMKVVQNKIGVYSTKRHRADLFWIYFGIKDTNIYDVVSSIYKYKFLSILLAMVAVKYRHKLTRPRDNELAELAAYSENSMRALSKEQIGVLSCVRTHYRDRFKQFGREEILNSLREYLESAYEANPVVINGKKMPLILTKRQIKNLAATTRMAYYKNIYHTAWRYLFARPNPWMHKKADHVEVMPGRDNKAAMIRDDDLTNIAYFWLAATDETVAPIDGFTLESRKEKFAHELWYLGRAHNWHKKFRGKTVDDMQADRPSCPMGVTQRAMQLVMGNPIAQMPEARDLNPDLFAAKFSQEALVVSYNKYVASLNKSQRADLLQATEKAFVMLEGDGLSLPERRAIESCRVGDKIINKFNQHAGQYYGNKRLEASASYHGISHPSYQAFAQALGTKPWVYYYNTLKHLTEVCDNQSETHSAKPKALRRSARLKEKR